MYFQRLEDLRVDADLTQEQVAQVLHCKREVYRRYEKGIHELPVCCSRRSAIETSPFMASVIFLSFFFLIRLFMVGVLLQIAFADFVVVKYFVRLHKGGSAP